MRVDAEERGIVAQFFAMLRDKSWIHASSADGTDVFKLPGERIHRIMGVTRTDATPEEVLTFFSDPKNFDEHFKILDDMFKSGSVVKIGGAGLEVTAAGGAPRGGLHKPGNFAALSIGGKDRSGPIDPEDLADGVVEFFSKLRRSVLGAKIEAAYLRAKTLKKSVKDPVELDESPLAALDALPSARTEATRAALERSSGDAGVSSAYFESFENATIAVPSDMEDDLKFKDRPGHALLHGTFRLPSIVPDRDFIWDQVALRLPTGSVLIAGKSVEDFHEDEIVPVRDGHVRGAVLTSGYYVAPETEAKGGGSTIAFVVQADPKGSLPAWVVNFVAPKQAHNVTRLRKYLDGH
jgi:hypothetical protein